MRFILRTIGVHAWWVLATVLSVSVVGKILTLGEFAEGTSTLTFVPWTIRQWLPLGVPVSELVAAYLLVVPQSRKLGMVLAALLLSFFTAFLIYRVADPFAPDCKCFGLISIASDAHTSNKLALARNLLLLVPAFAGVWHASLSRRDFTGELSAWSRPERHRGFTLVELLVVIGIIGLLLGLLLPVLARARQAARLAVCANQQRQVTTATTAYALDHEGFAPLAGEVFIPAGISGYGSLPRALDDSHRRRYAYLRDPRSSPTLELPTLEHVMPFPLALLTYLGEEDVSPPVGAVGSDLVSLYPSLTAFLCPDGPGARDTRLEDSVLHIFETWSAGGLWWPSSDYTVNGGLLGFDFRSIHAPMRLRGKLVRARAQSQTMLLADAACHRRYLPTPAVTPRLAPDEAGRPITLADVFGSLTRFADGPPPDEHRHNGRVNVAFLDGHVKAVRPGADEVGEIYLLSE